MLGSRALAGRVARLAVRGLLAGTTLNADTLAYDSASVGSQIAGATCRPAIVATNVWNGTNQIMPRPFGERGSRAGGLQPAGWNDPLAAESSIRFSAPDRVVATTLWQAIPATERLDLRPTDASLDATLRFLSEPYPAGIGDLDRAGQFAPAALSEPGRDAALDFGALVNITRRTLDGADLTDVGSISLDLHLRPARSVSRADQGGAGAWVSGYQPPWLGRPTALADGVTWLLAGGDPRLQFSVTSQSPADADPGAVTGESRDNPHAVADSGYRRDGTSTDTIIFSGAHDSPATWLVAGPKGKPTDSIVGIDSYWGSPMAPMNIPEPSSLALWIVALALFGTAGIRSGRRTG